MWIILIAVIVLGTFHTVLGVMSLCLGVAASIQAEVWMAHSVSPIWSGGFFIITGVLGFACAKWKTAYMILCFTAFSIVSMVTAVVSIQLLRLGLVNETTDGLTFQKEHLDMLIIVALGVAGTECLVCLISAVASCRLARSARKELLKKRDGTFHVQDFTSAAGDCSVSTPPAEVYANPHISIEDVDEVCDIEDFDYNVQATQVDNEQYTQAMSRNRAANKYQTDDIELDITD